MTTLKAYAAGSEFPPLKKDTLRLYNMRMCPYAQRAVIVLAYKNIPHETININLSKKPDWYLELNPLGLVPAIQMDDKVVYESLVVCEYLDQTYPGEKVVPADPYQRAKDTMFIERFSKIVSKYYAFLFAKDEALKATHAQDIVAGYDMMEKELKTRNSKFFGGDKPMLIDFTLWPHMQRLSLYGRTVCPALAITDDRWPLVYRWIGSVLDVPAVAGTTLSSENLMEFARTYMDGNPDYDLGLEE